MQNVERAIVLAVVSLATGVGGCASSEGPPPIARVSFAASASRVALGSPVELTYRFEVAADAAISDDYTVFMHVKTPSGTRLWGDDHQPAVPTSQWKPGQTVEYTRARFVPPVAHLGEAVVEVGLYRDSQRLVLEVAGAGPRPNPARSYRVGQFQFLPQLDSVAVTFATGWHGIEFSPDDPAVTWQWSRKSATLRFRNPKRDGTLLLEYEARSDVFGGQAQQVTLLQEGKAIATFPADRRDPTLRRIPITTAQFGTGDLTVLTLEVDRTFVPAQASPSSKDTRELGIRVYHAFVELR